jgi:hypothetical protein
MVTIRKNLVQIASSFLYPTLKALSVPEPVPSGKMHKLVKTKYAIINLRTNKGIYFKKT